MTPTDEELAEMAPIIFLDFDGVICSPRAFTAQEGRWCGTEYRALRWADPIACDLVQRLASKHHAKVVVSSTWRSSRDQCDQILGRYRISKFLHRDWRTGEDKDRFRGREIDAWLETHGRPPFIILDDDSDMLPEQMPFLVNTCSMNGMMLSDFDKADKMLAAITSKGPAHEIR